MPAPLNVNREAVKTLAIAVGVREAARQMNLPEDTVKTWSGRGNWFKKVQKPPTMAREPTETMSPSNALTHHLNEMKARSLRALSEYSAKASEQALSAKDPLKISRKVKDVADIHKTIWPAENEQSNILQIGILIQH